MNLARLDLVSSLDGLETPYARVVTDPGVRHGGTRDSTQRELQELYLVNGLK
jgi:hypothetical protein